VVGAATREPRQLGQLGRPRRDPHLAQLSHICTQSGGRSVIQGPDDGRRVIVSCGFYHEYCNLMYSCFIGGFAESKMCVRQLCQIDFAHNIREFLFSFFLFS